MSDTERVRAWRQRLKEDGLVPMTIWVKAETKACYEDLALQSHRSPSEIARQVLDAYRLNPAALAAYRLNPAALAALVTEAITEMLPAIVAAAVRDLVTATVTETDTDTAEHEPPEALEQR